MAAEFVHLARMSWERWRVCVARSYLQAHGYATVLAEVAGEMCRHWQDRYGQVQSGELPFGVDEGLLDLPRLLPLLEVRADWGKAEQSGVSEADGALWRAVLEELSLQMTQATFATWLADTCLIAREENRFVVSVRDEPAREWVSYRLREPILRTLRHMAGMEQVDVSFIVWSH